MLEMFWDAARLQIDRPWRAIWEFDCVQVGRDFEKGMPAQIN